MPSSAPRLLDVPGLTGPSMLGTIAFRNAMQLGYGVNVLLAGGGSVGFLLGRDVAVVWSWVVVAASLSAILGVLATAQTSDTRLELWSSIVVLGTYAAQCMAVILCFAFALGPNGLLPFWWPAALAGQGLWRIRNIVASERAKAAARLR